MRPLIWFIRVFIKKLLQELTPKLGCYEISNHFYPESSEFWYSNRIFACFYRSVIFPFLLHMQLIDIDKSGFSSLGSNENELAHFTNMATCSSLKGNDWSYGIWENMRRILYIIYILKAILMYKIMYVLCWFSV